jgi:hypothetical protein
MSEQLQLEMTWNTVRMSMKAVEINTHQGQLARDNKGLSIVMAVSPSIYSYEARPCVVTKTVIDLLSPCADLVDLFHREFGESYAFPTSESQMVRHSDRCNLDFDRCLVLLLSRRCRLLEESPEGNYLGNEKQRYRRAASVLIVR